MVLTVNGADVRQGLILVHWGIGEGIVNRVYILEPVCSGYGYYAVHNSEDVSR